MSTRKIDDKDQQPLQKKLEELIKKKSEENTALKKLLDGLNDADSSQKNRK